MFLFLRWNKADRWFSSPLCPGEKSFFGDFLPFFTRFPAFFIDFLLFFIDFHYREALPNMRKINIGGLISGEMIAMHMDCEKVSYNISEFAVIPSLAKITLILSWALSTFFARSCEKSEHFHFPLRDFKLYEYLCCLFIKKIIFLLFFNIVLSQFNILFKSLEQ